MLFIPMNINEEEQQLCRQEKELKSDEVIFQIPKEREEKKTSTFGMMNVMLINYDKLKREKEYGEDGKRKRILEARGRE